MAVDIGGRVAALRGKMSAQQLADRCAALGMPSLSRIVITRLENGRREVVSTAELCVLAAALGVPPAELMFPVGSGDSAEILPGVAVPVLDAVRWLAGGMRLDAGASGTVTMRALGSGEQNAVGLLETHARMARQWQAEDLAAAEAADPAVVAAVVAALPRKQREAGRATLQEQVEMAERRRDLAAESLQLVRAEMRRRGMILPPAPRGLDGGPGNPRV
jgi:transcriptional regulator with XRE-family HTH domain